VTVLASAVWASAALALDSDAQLRIIADKLNARCTELRPLPATPGSPASTASAAA
jgi:hypothetical protein